MLDGDQPRPALERVPNLAGPDTMTPLYVVVNGGYRTGSTVAYNVVRAILQRHSLEYASGLRSHPSEIDTGLAWHRLRPAWTVVKCHIWRPLGTDAIPGLRVIYTVRDPYDVAASMLERDDRWSWPEILCEVQRQALLNVYHSDPERSEE